MSLTPPAALEALLFASGEPLTKKRLAGLLSVSPEDLAKAVDALRESLTSRGLALIETKDELELRTSPDAADFVKKLRESELSRDLGRAGLETLAIILYRGGATRSEIDWIRGVNSSATVRSLLLRALIERTEDQTDRRRARYLLTAEALAHLGIERAEEAPEFADLSTALTESERVKAEEETQTV